MSTKLRLSASVDRELLGAAQAAVQAGRADNVSAWVNEALHRHAEHDRRMQALDAFLEHYEAGAGVITEQEMADAERSMRARALATREAAGRRPVRRTAAQRTRKVSKRRG